MKMYDKFKDKISLSKQNIDDLMIDSKEHLSTITKGQYLAGDTHIKRTATYIKGEVKKISHNSEVDTSRTLLNDTNKELNYIVACILQTSSESAYNYTKEAGQILTSKLVGVGISGGLLSLVSSFGTASTGTAISTLAGASATNATMAWVGSMVGGGMFAGTVLSGGLAIGVGVVAYKLLSSDAREYSDISVIERDIVDRCIFIIRLIDELNNRLTLLNKKEIGNMLKDYILPLHTLLIENETQIVVNLDNKNTLAFQIHALPDFDVLVERYKNF